MKVLIDIIHPAHVHFFKFLIRELKRNHNQVLVTSRKKTITEKLLEEENIPYISLGGYKNNLDKIIKTIPIIFRLVSILKIYKFNKKDFIMGISPVQASIASLFVRSHCIAFTDTDFAPEQFYIFCFLSKFVFTPKWFSLKVYGAKQIKYEGCQEYNYLNEDYFNPNIRKIRKYGLKPGKFIIVRLIEWNATHDIGKKGIFNINAFLEILSKKYNIIITSEYPIQNRWENNIFKGKLCDFHHLLYYSAGYIGEAFTTAQEALVLGKPSVLINPINCHLFDQFNGKKEKLCIKTNDYLEAIKIFNKLVDLDEEKKREIAENYRKNFIDLNKFILKFIYQPEKEK